MKKALLLFTVAGLVLAAGLSGYKLLRQTGPAAGERPAASISSKSSVAEISEVSAPLLPADAPRSTVFENGSQPQPAVQVVSTPDSRFQPIAEAQIIEQRVTVVSEDQKKRELLVRAEGKYPYRRVEETLMKNGADDTYMIAARTEMVASHVLVKLQEGRTEDDLRAMLEGHGVSILRPMTLPGHYIISLKAPTLDAVPDALSVFSAESNVLAYTEPDFYSSMLTVPNDSSWSNLWGMVKINATGAWDVATGSTNVIVAVIDTGIDTTHPDLVSNLWVNATEANGTTGVDDDGNGFVDDMNGWDFANNDKIPADDVGHGTHCAGTIGAVGNNGLGVAGVCWKVRLMALKALGTSGGTASDIGEAIQYASDRGAKIISASLGGSSYSDTMRDAIVYAGSNGVLFVAAAGNDGVDNDLYPHYPSSYDLPNIVSVAATDQNDALAPFSNYGKTSVDLAAPGVAVYSTVPGGTNAEYNLGTSMACPHVAGAAALLLSYKPSLTHLQLKQALLKTVDPVPALTNKTVSGGRLNVYKLLTLLDTDNDGMPDNWEQLYFGNPTNALPGVDPDSDGLTNLEEYSNGTNPQVADTDGDTLPDGWEVTYGFDPNSPAGGSSVSSRRGIYLGDGAKNIAVAGNYAYVAAGSAGLGVLNIADPQNPVRAGFCGTGGTANDVAVAGNYAYVANGANGLAIVDVTTPASPWLVVCTDTPGTAQGVAVQSNYVYLADGNNSLMTFDVSNPASPRVTADYSYVYDMHDVFVQGSSVYAALVKKVWRFSLANPAVPDYGNAASLHLDEDMIGIHGNQYLIVAAAGSSGVYVMSATNLNWYTDGSLYDTPGTASGVFVSGNYAYIADGANGLVVLNLTIPTAPTQAVHVATAGTANGVFVSGDKVYVATSVGVEIFSILLDSDGDGLPDNWEIQYFGDLLRTGTLDWDGDGISDRGEYLAGTNPKNTDSDGDGLTDGAEIVTRGTDPTSSDTDGDGLSDGAEVLTHGTNPLLADTDGDGFLDGFEVANGFDPLVAEPSTTDHDKDGLTDAQEVVLGTDPANDSDPIWVDDDAAGDVAVGGEWDSEVSDPLADGSIAHPFDAIQKAIDSTRATNGITILVTNGTYYGQGNYAIDTKGKALKIRSLNGPASTIINSLDLGPVLNLSTDEGTNTTIQGFSMTSSGGGYSVVVLDGVSVQLNNCWIYDSLSSGIECLNAASPSVSSCTVYNVKNGIYATSTGLTVQNSAISNCTGRGIVIVNDDFAEVTWSTIENCAGGITLDNSDAAIRQCIVRNNTDTNGTGAGILLKGNSSPWIQNALIVSNRAGTGGGLYISSGCNPTGVNCTVANNYAGTSGGGLATDGKPVLRNMIIWGNTAVVSNKSIHKITANNFTITHSCVEGGFPTLITGAVTNNPLFVGGSDYHLASTNSPCYNKGTSTSAPTVDLDGNPRPMAGKFDMGCYEGVGSGSGGGGGTDTDGDGMPDTWETAHGLNPAVNDAALDPDGDTLTNLQEYNLGTNPQVADTDGDTMPDGWEFTYMPPLSPTNSLDGLLDSDLDGLTNKFEYSNGCNPTNSDTDADGLPDGWEVRYTLSPTNAVGADGAAGDPDGDTLTNLQEYNLGTNPQVADTDGDGFADNVEISMGTLPTNGHDPVFVDDDAAGDVAAGNPNISDPLANGSSAHPFDAIQKAISTNTTVSGMTIFVTNGLYEGIGNYSINPQGKNLRILASGSNVVIKTHGYGSAFVINSGEATNTIIRGFTIETFGDEAPEEGIVVDGASPVLEDLVINNCELEAVSCLNGAAPRILNGRFYDVLHGLKANGSAGVLLQQSVVSNTSGRGIVIVNDDSAQILGSTIENCAGGISLDNSDAQLEQCIFRKNTGIDGAGILLQNNSSPWIRNALIVSNTATGNGGGFFIGSGCNPTGVNCTVAENNAGVSGGGVSSAGRPVFRNMIFWSNTAATSPNLHVSTNVINVWYSDIQYGHSNAVNSVTNNPLFVGGGDYHLASTNSPCYNSGDFYLAPTNDLDGNPRPTALPQKVDMGCYEGIGSGSGGGGGGSLTDTDGDGLPDIYEYNLGSSNLWASVYTNVIGAPATFFFGSPLGTPGMPGSTDPQKADTDGDGLSDLYEITTNAAITNLFITNPNKEDTDGDGFLDGFEVANGFNPLVAENPATTDHDLDGLTDAQEVALGTNPANRYDPVYVDDNAPGDPMPGEPNISSTNENGSITYPFDSIQEAIDWTNTVNGMTILVTNGTYEGTGNFNVNPRGKSIQIRSVNGSTNTFIITHAYGSAFVINSGETTNTLIRGFTIETQGDLAPEEGVVVSGTSPVLQDLVIHNCELEAVSCINGAAPQILNSRFYNVPNGLFADGSAGVLLQQCVISNTSGRGIVIKDDDLAKVTWSTITNCAGGITLDNSDASIRQCFIRGNEAPNYYTTNGITIASRSLFDGSVLGSADITDPDENGAGVLLLNGSSPLLQNCLIAGNKTWADDPEYSDVASRPLFGVGAGIYVNNGCNPTGVNCTVVSNHANTRGGGLGSAGRPFFRNMIFWDNTSSNATIVAGVRSLTAGVDPNIYLIDEVINIWYSDIEGGYANEVLCIDSDPLFVGGTNYSLQGTSPCRTNGTYYLAPRVDIAGNLRPEFTDYPARVDMGCYQYGAFASTNPIALGAELALEAPEADPLMDTDGDGVSNGAEMSAGTDIYNSDSYFRVYNEQVVAGGSVLISWQSTPGYAYAVQTTSSLMSPWTTVTNMTGTGAVMSFTGDMPTDTVRYYRVLVRKP